MKLSKILFENKRYNVLYHGTKAKYVPEILRGGLSAAKSKSSLQAVFLTDDVGMARNYTLMDMEKGDKPVVLRIDVSKLDKDKLGPDNYELQQFLDGEMGDVPEELEGMSWDDLSWEESLQYVNQAAYHGDIPPEAIHVVSLSKILFESVQPPEPKQADMLDALEMVRESYPEEMENKELEDFDLTYLGKLFVDEIGQYADLSSWMEEFDKDDVEGMKKFRGEKWFDRMEDFVANNTMPPIIVVEGDGFVDVGDGRGRVTYANWKGIPLHVYKLKVKQ